MGSVPMFSFSLNGNTLNHHSRASGNPEKTFLEKKNIENIGFLPPQE